MNRIYSTAISTMMCSALAAGAAQAEQQLAAAPASADLAEMLLALPADDSYWEVSTGFDYSRGTFGALQPTTISYVPVGLAYHQDRWTIAVDSGFIKIKSPLNYSDIFDLLGEDIAVRDPAANIATVRGVTDTVLGVKYALINRLDSGFFVDAGVRFKLPTASSGKGLGTGHVAADLQIDMTKIFDPWSLFASIEYGIRDGRDADRNPWSGSAGVGRILTDRLSAGGFYNVRQSAHKGGRAAHEAFVYASYAFTDRFSVTAYAARGFSSSSIDHEFGLRYAYRWP